MEEQTAFLISYFKFWGIVLGIIIVIVYLKTQIHHNPVLYYDVSQGKEDQLYIKKPSLSPSGFIIFNDGYQMFLWTPVDHVFGNVYSKSVERTEFTDWETLFKKTKKTES